MRTCLISLLCRGSSVEYRDCNTQLCPGQESVCAVGRVGCGWESRGVVGRVGCGWESGVWLGEWGCGWESRVWLGE